MRYAIIEDGRVTNSVIADAARAPNWVESDAPIGSTYNGQAFTPPAPHVDPCEWLIDIGPFFDRFGPAGMAAELSTSPIAQAVLRNLNRRKWIDLKDSRVATAIDTLMAVVPEITADIKTHVLATKVGVVENQALRTLYYPAGATL